MTGLHQTVFGKALVAIKHAFGIAPDVANEQVDKLGETIKADAEAAFKPILIEIQTLAVQDFHTIVDTGIAAVKAAFEGKDLTNIKDDQAALEIAMDSVRKTATAVVKDDVKPLSVTAAASLGSVILAHIHDTSAAN